MNWGKGITIALILFIGFIGSMVYVAFTKNADLVSDEYYENELSYDQTKAEKANYLALNTNIQIDKEVDGIVFKFPNDLEQLKEGSIVFYRPDQKKYDRTFNLELSAGNTQSLDYNNFVDGYYDISIRWEDLNEKIYIFESSILF
ncbi:MAG: cytochrome C oxidase Cbb3 [Crocinitomix sp.]|nr:cytochrome C oxidase Cbb3 [Crocinitomix sp.]